MEDGTGYLLFTASTWVLPVLLAVTFHEAAHAWVAWKLGDDTAKRLGRVTFNPLAHVDAFGTVILPGMLILIGSPFLFGYAKPVPINFMRLRNPRIDMVKVAFAGPGANFILAYIAALLFHTLDLFPAVMQGWLELNLHHAILLNVILGVFNLLPLPPLDGGRIAVGLLPDKLAIPLARLERYGFLILIGLLFLGPMLGRLFGLDINPLIWILGPPIGAVMEALIFLSGHG